MERRKQKSVIGECTYCGNLARLTNDHVPPKALFPSPRPSNLTTVPACNDCNHAASLDDEYFRLVLVLRQDLSSNASAVAGIEAALRGLRRRQGIGLRKSFLSSFQEVELRTPSGIYLGKGGTYEPDLQRLIRVAERTVRGLFYSHKRRRIPDDWTILTYLPEAFDPRHSSGLDLVFRMADTLAGQPESRIGDVFAYRYFFVDGHHTASIWSLSFFRRVHFLAAIAPPEAVAAS